MQPQPMRVTRARDQLDDAGSRPASPPIQLAPLVGSWVNFNEGSTGILRIEIAERGGELAVRPFGACAPDPCDWGEARSAAFADDVALGEAVAFMARYELGFQRVLLVGYVNRRLLTLEMGSTFTDGSGRSPYFTREHFYATPAP